MAGYDERGYQKETSLEKWVKIKHANSVNIFFKLWVTFTILIGHNSYLKRDWPRPANISSTLHLVRRSIILSNIYFYHLNAWYACVCTYVCIYSWVHVCIYLSIKYTPHLVTADSSSLSFKDTVRNYRKNFEFCFKLVWE